MLAMRWRDPIGKWKPLFGTTMRFCSRSLLKTISPETGHFVHRPSGMFFFFREDESLGLAKCVMVLLAVSKSEGIERGHTRPAQNCSAGIERGAGCKNIIDEDIALSRINGCVGGQSKGIFEVLLARLPVVESLRFCVHGPTE